MNSKTEAEKEAEEREASLWWSRHTKSENDTFASANAFLKEYVELCKKHGYIVNGCGCLDSPWVVFPSHLDDLDKHFAHLEKGVSDGYTQEEQG